MASIHSSHFTERRDRVFFSDFLPPFPRFLGISPLEYYSVKVAWQAHDKNGGADGSSASLAGHIVTRGNSTLFFSNIIWFDRLKGRNSNWQKDTIAKTPFTLLGRISILELFIAGHFPSAPW